MRDLRALPELLQNPHQKLNDLVLSHANMGYRGGGNPPSVGGPGGVWGGSGGGPGGVRGGSETGLGGSRGAPEPPTNQRLIRMKKNPKTVI